MKINLILLVFILLFVNIFVDDTAPDETVKEKMGLFDNIIGNISNISTQAENIIKGVVRIGNNAADTIGINTTKYGAKFLDMKADDKGIYHADFECWQKYFGYNKLYDIMFDLGTSMKYNNEGIFSYNGTNYILWAWKGDYINLGAGGELGIYKDGKDKDSHWQAARENAMPMSITITHKTLGTIVNKYSNTTWWITAFNPKHKNVDAADLTAKYSVTFTNAEMYKAFEKTKSAGWTFNSASKTATLVL